MPRTELTSPPMPTAQHRRPSQLLFADGGFAELRAALLADAALESFAFLLARPVHTPGRNWRLLVYKIVPISEAEYAHRSATRIELPPAALARATARARDEGASLILAHSHPTGASALPSATDRLGERQYLPALVRRLPEVPIARLIVSETEAHAAIIAAPGSSPASQETLLDVCEIGRTVRTWEERFAAGDAPRSEHPDPDRQADRFDRQIRAFGAMGHERLQRLRVAIVGLGGTGSHVVQQLVYLGIKRFLLVDADHVEATNLNRVVGASVFDIGRRKTDVARDVILRVNPDADIETANDICDADTARQLLDVDVFLCCTDTHGSRAVLAELSYQYLLPGIDVGVAIDRPYVRHEPDAEVRDVRLSGRVQMLAPSLPCFVCTGGILDSELVRRELLTPLARAADAYIVGAHVPQPAVVSINGTVASLAVTMLLAAFTDMSASARHIRLRLERGSMAPVEGQPHPRCPVCSSGGRFLRGDTAPAPGRAQP